MGRLVTLAEPLKSMAGNDGDEDTEPDIVGVIDGTID